jgi:heterodisulfide reductase subunit B
MSKAVSIIQCTCNKYSFHDVNRAIAIVENKMMNSQHTLCSTCMYHDYGVCIMLKRNDWQIF